MRKDPFINPDDVSRCVSDCKGTFAFFFFFTFKPRVRGYTKPTRLQYEPASEPLQIYVK